MRELLGLLAKSTKDQESIQSTNLNNKSPRGNQFSLALSILRIYLYRVIPDIVCILCLDVSCYCIYPDLQVSLYHAMRSFSLHGHGSKYVSRLDALWRPGAPDHVTSMTLAASRRITGLVIQNLRSGSLESIQIDHLL